VEYQAYITLRQIGTLPIWEIYQRQERAEVVAMVCLKFPENPKRKLDNGIGKMPCFAIDEPHWETRSSLAIKDKIFDISSIGFKNRIPVAF